MIETWIGDLVCVVDPSGKVHLWELHLIHTTPPDFPESIREEIHYAITDTGADSGEVDGHLWTRQDVKIPRRDPIVA